MAPKRPFDPESAASAGPAAKKKRKGFRVGPGNLPDGPWKRKVTKIKNELIHKAKVKKEYEKVKAEEEARAQAEAASKSKAKSTTEDGQAVNEKEDGGANQPPSPQLHPERQAMLGNDDGGDDDVSANPNAIPLDPQNPGDHPPPPRKRKSKQRKPGYFDKAIEEADRKRAEAEARAQEMERRRVERERKLAERQRFQRALANARTPGRDGKRKLGRESGLLLEKVKRMVGDAK
ncbi:hypothetical protein DL766_003358 [Monosporascus sp. MC13-8B]|uniref:rRNA-processing protein FYV7 n=1 Tax=Monosporascus cannonballus TaxID=155416 RepID=A0ABY0HE39_9PEZI|nr:hypothetical protein DL762_002374 [Monosporascus cannonballus]RYO99202.1 hypothetical protein DL763_001692 [Monosporascus cannonballus]RYP33609.1 hypothetical protein DL766_003358 [Monosporascus sp. MC13-8B]